jgi:acyl-homoserine-lactone acylase
MKLKKQIIFGIFSSFLLGIFLTFPVLAQDPIYPEKGYVRIVRDTYGIPHVYASNDKDVYFGFGYAVAGDRLEQLITALFASAGRSAEIMGSERIALDSLLRSFQHKKYAKKMKKGITRDIKIKLTAYCNGVNAYIKDHRNSIPSWIKKIKPIDIAYLGVARNIFACGQSLSGDYYQAWQGSNAFAIAGYNSSSGHAMLSYDSHSAWLDPLDKYYEIHISTPEYFCVGNMNPGAPVFNNGFNGKIAWAGTANSPDIADILKFQVNADSTQYLSRSGWKPIKKWNETIKVKTGSGLKNQAITLRSTDDGAVWALEEDYVYVCKIPEFIDTPELIKYAFERVTAASVTEFMDLFRTQNYMTGHKFCADLQGHIGYIYSAPWPKRDPALDWSKPVDGTDPRSEWLGYVSYDELPKIYNPASGWLQNCNGDPQYVTTNSGITSDLPGRLNQPGFGERGKRLTELLSRKPNMRLKDMFTFSRDTLVWKARFWAPLLVDAFDAYADSLSLRGTDAETAINLFRNWDYRAEKKSKAMAVFHYFYDRFNTAPYWDIIASEDKDDITETAKKSLLGELNEAAALVKSYFGRVDIPWGEVQYFRYGKEFPMPGSGGSGGWLQTLRSAGHQTLEEDGRIHVTGGSAYQYIIELSDTPRMWSAIPVGESDDPTSKHYNDLTQLFSKKKYKPVWYSWDKLSRHIESDVTISTKKRK